MHSHVDWLIDCFKSSKPYWLSQDWLKNWTKHTCGVKFSKWLILKRELHQQYINVHTNYLAKKRLVYSIPNYLQSFSVPQLITEGHPVLCTHTRTSICPVLWVRGLHERPFSITPAMKAVALCLPQKDQIDATSLFVRTVHTHKLNKQPTTSSILNNWSTNNVYQAHLDTSGLTSADPGCRPVYRGAPDPASRRRCWRWGWCWWGCPGNKHSNHD